MRLKSRCSPVDELSGVLYAQGFSGEEVKCLVKNAPKLLDPLDRKCLGKLKDIFGGPLK